MSNTIKLMGNALLSLLLALALVLSVPFAGNRATSYAQSITFGYFYSSLSPYGRWVIVEPYGRVWYPSGVPVGWQPYTVGRWVYTEYGWTWISLDPWGDIPYHYGTWTYASPYGWVWVPGYVWAPAWVTWSYSDAYVGWAPIPPTLSITSQGYVGPPVVVEHVHYVFVPVHRFVNVNVTTVRVPVERNVTVIRETRNVTNFKVVGGIVRNTAVPVTHVEMASRTRIQNTNISAVNTKPTRIEAGGRSKGDKLPVAGPPERKTERVEEKSDRRERQTRLQQGIPPQRGTGRGSSEPQVAAPPERKTKRMEEKPNQREEQRRPRNGISPQPPIEKQHGQKHKDKSEKLQERKEKKETGSGKKETGSAMP